MVPPNYVKIFVCQGYQKNWRSSFSPSKNGFLGPHFGGFLKEWPKKISGDKIVFAAQQLNPKIRFRCFVVKEKKSEQHLGGKREKSSSRPKLDW